MGKIPFKTLFPSKKLLNRVLFHMDSDLPSRKLLPLFERLYDHNALTAKDTAYADIPNVIFLMNRVLVELKHRTKQQPIPLHKMELYLLKKAAKLGNNDAIALLCYQILGSSQPTTQPQEDIVQSQQLLKQLVKQNHPLSFKVLADLNCHMGQFDEGKRWYKQYLKAIGPITIKNPDIKFWGSQQKGEVLEKLGEIEFREGGDENIIACEKRFLESIRITPLKNSVKSYFYLAMLYIKYDPSKAKVLLEQCCTQGFKEAFNELGYLEMNYFQNSRKAREWFKLGMEVMELQSFFGYFECCVTLKDWSKTHKCLKSINKMLSNESISEANKQSIIKFLQYHEANIKLIQSKLEPALKSDVKEKTSDTVITETASKWGF
ncbi:protein Mss2p, mitochondrial [Monosporozyma unispora]|nr:hypothetical protein C6P44_005341 [Kazachstania unispora]